MLRNLFRVPKRLRYAKYIDKVMTQGISDDVVQWQVDVFLSNENVIK